MEIDIYVKEVSGGRELRIPWLPDSVSYDTNGARMASYDIIDVGEVKVPAGSNLESISWSSYLPGEGHSSLPFLRGSWQNPKNIQNLFNEWKNDGTPLRIIMTGTPINHDVYLTDFNSDYESGYGDYSYDIKFEQKRDIKIVSTKVKVATSSGSGGGKTHTVKKGDTLWDLARKYYGSGAKYGTIYNANKTIIEATAKKYGKKSSDGGHWIYPGTVLTIPGSSSGSSSKSSSKSSGSSTSSTVNRRETSRAHLTN